MKMDMHKCACVCELMSVEIGRPITIVRVDMGWSSTWERDSTSSFQRMHLHIHTRTRMTFCERLRFKTGNSWDWSANDTS